MSFHSYSQIVCTSVYLYTVTYHTTPYHSTQHNIIQHHTSLHFITLNQPTPHRTPHIHTYPHNITTIYIQPYHTTQYHFTSHITHHTSHITQHTHTQTHTHTHIAIDPIVSDSNIYFGYSQSMVNSTYDLEYVPFFLNLKISILIFFYSISYFVPSRTVVVKYSFRLKEES